MNIAEERLASSFVNFFLGIAALALLLLLIEERSRNLKNAKRYCESLFEEIDTSQPPEPIVVTGALRWNYNFRNLIQKKYTETGKVKELQMLVAAPNHPDRIKSNNPTLRDLIVRQALSENYFNFTLNTSPSFNSMDSSGNDNMVVLKKLEESWNTEAAANATDLNVYNYSIFATEDTIEIQYPETLSKIRELKVLPIGLAPEESDYGVIKKEEIKYSFTVNIKDSINSRDFATMWENSEAAPISGNAKFLEPYWDDIKAKQHEEIAAYFDRKIKDIPDQLRGSNISIAGLKIDIAFLSPAGPFILLVFLLVFWSRLRFIVPSNFLEADYWGPVSIPLSRKLIDRAIVAGVVAMSIFIAYLTARIPYGNGPFWNNWVYISCIPYAILATYVLYKHGRVLKSLPD